ncbi:hypothetical protein H4Q26_012344 [Puccinia striiformis f. sp. tritici PST-130]|nr:hypothetical protein H4Q26_012344 [Puccinia striiformis f. sp. tritici PST-130]
MHQGDPVQAAKSSGGFIWDVQGASSGLDDPSSSADASLSEEPDSEADVSSGLDSDDDESPSAFRACNINTDSQISKRLTCHTTSDINRISDENLISDLERPSTVPSDQQPERNIDNQLLSQQNNLSKFTSIINTDSQISKRLTCHTTSDINRISDENLISDLERPSTVPSDQQPERNIDNQLLSQQNNLSFQPDKNNSSSLIKRISLSLPNTNSVE